MHLQTFCEGCAQKLAAEKNTAIPWAIILELIMTLLDRCQPTEQRFLEMAKTPTQFQRVAALVHAKKVIGNRREAKACIDCLADCCKEMTDENICCCYEECCAALGGIHDHDDHDHEHDQATAV